MANKADISGFDGLNGFANNGSYFNYMSYECA
jgi:hypothetical protein